MTTQTLIDSKICPSCGETNNPSFSECWKCDAPLPSEELHSGKKFIQLQNHGKQYVSTWKKHYEERGYEVEVQYEPPERAFRKYSTCGFHEEGD